MTEQDVLRVENLRKSYNVRNGKRVAAVNDISFTVKSGEILALLGPNGAGKTTTIKMLSGLLLPSTGIVRINGLDPFTDRRALKCIGSVLEGNRNLYWRMTGYENLVYFGILKGMTYKDASQHAKQLIKQFNLEDKHKTQVRNLSRGMQQRLAIAVSLVHRPSLLLLDEPALGLDAQSTIDVKNMVKSLTSEGIGVLLTTHQFDIAEELSDRVAIIDKGRIINEERTQDLLKRHANNIYEIYLLEPLASEQLHNLRALPFKTEYQQDCVTIACLPYELYQAFTVIQPAPIRQITRYKSDLSSIFLKLTGSKLTEEKDIEYA